MRLELTCVGLIVELANHYTIRRKAFDSSNKKCCVIENVGKKKMTNSDSNLFID